MGMYRVAFSLHRPLGLLDNEFGDLNGGQPWVSGKRLGCCNHQTGSEFLFFGFVLGFDGFVGCSFGPDQIYLDDGWVDAFLVSGIGLVGKVLVQVDHGGVFCGDDI